MNIGIFTHFDNNFKEVGNITYPILQKYAEKHGYHAHCITERNSDRHPVWDKVKIIRDNLDKYDWLMYVDADTLITNHTIKLEDIIDDSFDLIISRDVNDINSGVFFIKSSEWSKKYLDDVWGIDPRHPIYNNICRFDTTQGEQRAMIACIEHETNKKHIRIDSQSLYNSYLYGIYGMSFDEGQWTEGKFILHLPGVENEKRVKIFTEKLSSIIYEK